MRLTPIALVLLFSIVASAMRRAAPPPQVEPPKLDSKMVDLAKAIDVHEKAIRDSKAKLVPTIGDRRRINLKKTIAENQKARKPMREELKRLAIEQAKSTLPVDPNAPHQTQIDQLKAEIERANTRISKHSGVRLRAIDRANSIAATARDKARNTEHRAAIRRLAAESGVYHGLSPSPPSSSPSSPEPDAKRAKPLPQSRQGTNPNPNPRPNLTPQPGGTSRPFVDQLPSHFSFNQPAPSPFGPLSGPYAPPLGFGHPSSGLGPPSIGFGHPSSVFGPASSDTGPAPSGFGQPSSDLDLRRSPSPGSKALFKELYPDEQVGDTASAFPRPTHPLDSDNLGYPPPASGPGRQDRTGQPVGSTGIQQPTQRKRRRRGQEGSEQ